MTSSAKIGSRLQKLEQRVHYRASKIHTVFADSSAGADQQIADLKRSGAALDTDDFVAFITIYEPPPRQAIQAVCQ